MSETKKIDEESEIDLLELVKILWNDRKFIVKFTIGGIIFGIIIALSIPKQYTTTVILTSETNNHSLKGMGILASMAGVDLGGGYSETFTPELYPEVLESTPFIISLFNVNVRDEESDIDTSLYLYMKDFQRYAWWSYILGIPNKLSAALSSSDLENTTDSINPKDERHISMEKMGVIDAIKKSYTISTDKKTLVTTIDVTMQSAEISSLLADSITSYLQKYIIDQRTRKAKTDLQNTENLHNEAKRNYYQAQQNFASHLDANMNVVFEKSKVNRDRLQNEVNLTYGVYTQMTQQLQISKIKVQDNTPVFTIIQPAVKPLGASKPKKKIIVITFTIFAFGVSGLWILKDFFLPNKNNKS